MGRICLEIFTLEVGNQAFELHHECQRGQIHQKIYKKRKIFHENQILEHHQTFLKKVALNTITPNPPSETMTIICISFF